MKNKYLWIINIILSIVLLLLLLFIKMTENGGDTDVTGSSASNAESGDYSIAVRDAEAVSGEYVFGDEKIFEDGSVIYEGAGEQSGAEDEASVQTPARIGIGDAGDYAASSGTQADTAKSGDDIIGEVILPSE